MRGFSKFFKLGPVVLLALFAALVSLSTAAGSVAGLATTPTGTASTKPIANFALCKAPTETPTPRPTKGPSPTATTAPTTAPATPTATTAVTAAAMAETSTPTAEPPTAVPVTPTAIPKGGKPATAGITALPNTTMVRGAGLKCINVAAVVAGGPADVAGIKKGDLILGVNTTQVKDAADFFTQIDKHASGDVVTITVQRGDAAMSLQVTLGLNQFATVPTPAATQ